MGKCCKTLSGHVHAEYFLAASMPVFLPLLSSMFVFWHQAVLEADGSLQSPLLQLHGFHAC